MSMSRAPSQEELAAQAAFLAQLPRMYFTDGQQLFEEGEDADDMMLILSGQVLLHRRSPWGERVCLSVLGPGQVCGEMAIFTPGPRSCSAVSVGETRVARLNRSTLLRMLVQRDPFARSLVRACTAVVARRLRHTRDLAEVLRLYREGAPTTEIDRRLAQLLSVHEGRVIQLLHRGPAR